MPNVAAQHNRFVATRHEGIGVWAVCAEGAAWGAGADPALVRLTGQGGWVQEHEPVVFPVDREIGLQGQDRLLRLKQAGESEPHPHVAERLPERSNAAVAREATAAANGLAAGLTVRQTKRLAGPLTKLLLTSI